MSYGICRDCHQQISWDEQKRKQYNTRRPLNLDGTIHSCSGTEVQQHHNNISHQVQIQPPESNNEGQDQKSKDIKGSTNTTQKRTRRVNQKYAMAKKCWHSEP